MSSSASVLEPYVIVLIAPLASGVRELHILKNLPKGNNVRENITNKQKKDMNSTDIQCIGSRSLQLYPKFEVRLQDQL